MPIKKGIFPGSFDPFTKGHEAVVRKALTLFDHVIIAVGINSSKSSLFTLESRLNHIQSLFEGEARIQIVTYEKLTVELCKDHEAPFIIRGLRDSKDFGYEKSIALMNSEISSVETVFFLTDQKFAAINSTIVREIYKNNGPIDSFVSNSTILHLDLV